MDALKPLLGLICVRARPGRGGICLDFGDLVEYDHPRLKGKYHGIWQVWSEYCSWRVFDGPQLLAGESDEEPVLKEAFDRLENQQLLDIELSERSSDARLRFSDGLVLELMEAAADLESWEAAGPDTWISFGPGPERTVSRGDEPDPGLTPEEALVSAHTHRCAERWARVVPPEAPADRRCRECVFYMPLRGMSYFWDYGLCTNPSSSFDGRVTNVRSGCDEHTAELEDLEVP